MDGFDSVAAAESGLWDPGEYLGDLLDNGLSTDVQSLVMRDERLDIPRAASFMEFCHSPSFLNFPPFPRQLQIASHMLGEICYHCSDADFMYQLFDQSLAEINEKIVFTRFGRCPKCQRTRLDFLKHQQWHFPESLIGVIGQRSGKNYLLGQLACYQLHRFLTFEVDGERVTPHKYMGLGPGMLTMTFTAATLGQAMRNIWNVFQPMIQNSPWFQEYFKYLRYHGNRIGEELIVNNNTFLRFRNKLIDVSCQAPNQSTLRGATRIGFGMDEICWHDVKQEEAKAGQSVLGSVRDVYVALFNSLKTVRNASVKLMRAGDFDVPTAYDWNISSPCHQNDIGMQMLRSADENKRIYSAHFATWEFNPEFKNGKADFASEYATLGEVEADRNFGAIPPLTVSPWIVDPKPLLLCVRPKQDIPVVTVDFRTEKSVFGEMTAWYEIKSLNDLTTPMILSIDNGYSNNAFALTLMSLGKNGLPYINQCLMLKPQEGSFVVNLAHMWDRLIYPLVTKANIKLVLYDRWNSLQNIQTLQNEGRDARQYSLTPKDFELFRRKLMNQEVSYPFSEYSPKVFVDNGSADVDLVQVSTTKPGFALLLQTLTVRQVGHRLVKPLHGDDDVFRTAMLGLKFAYDEDIAKNLGYVPPSQQKITQKRDINSLVSLRLKSGTGAGMGSTIPQPGQSKRVIGTIASFRR
jgi:hypothetical protein